MQTYRCPSCRDILLIVLPGDDVNETELHDKIERHRREKEELEKLYNES